MLQIDPVLVIENDTINAPDVIDLGQENIEKEAEKETAIAKEKKKGTELHSKSITPIAIIYFS